MVGEGSAFFASDWLEGLSSDWFLAVKRHLTFMAMAGCRPICACLRLLVDKIKAFKDVRQTEKKLFKTHFKNSLFIY